jgi:hypothetical protein
MVPFSLYKEERTSRRFFTPFHHSLPFEGKEKERRNCRMPRGCGSATTIANSNVSQEDETEVAAAITMLRRILCASTKQGLSEGIPVARP